MSRPPIPYDSNIGYDHFIRSCYDTDPATGDPINQSGNTKVGNRLDGTNNLHEAAMRLVDGNFILEDNLKIMTDPLAKKKDKKVAVRNLKKLGPLLNTAATVSSRAANVVSPIAGTKYAHQRLESMRAKEARVSPQINEDARLAKIESFVENEGSPDQSKPQPSKVTPPKKARPKHQKKRKLPSSLPDPPSPADGKLVYGVGEFLQIIYQFPLKKRRVEL